MDSSLLPKQLFSAPTIDFLLNRLVQHPEDFIASSAAATGYRTMKPQPQQPKKPTVCWNGGSGGIRVLEPSVVNKVNMMNDPDLHQYIEAVRHSIDEWAENVVAIQLFADQSHHHHHHAAAILIPACLFGDHWVLFVIQCNNRIPEAGRFLFVFDSNVHHTSLPGGHLYTYVDYCSHALCRVLSLTLIHHRNDGTPWSEQESTGTNDCGLYVLRNARDFLMTEVGCSHAMKKPGEVIVSTPITRSTLRKLVLSSSSKHTDPSGSKPVVFENKPSSQSTLVSPRTHLLNSVQHHTIQDKRKPTVFSGCAKGIALLRVGHHVGSEGVRHQTSLNASRGVLLADGRYVRTQDIASTALRDSRGQPYQHSASCIVSVL
eukprot:PhF_6_TR22379/c0_g1_i1/m.31737